MNDDTVIGGVLNQLGQTAKKTVAQVVSLPEEKTKEEKQPASMQGGETKPAKQWKSDEERKKFLQDLYGKPYASQPVVQSEKKPTKFQEQIADKSPDEQKKLMELRNQLHKEVYYDPTFNPVKKQEERPAEKVEHEKKKEMADLQKKEDKKPQPLAVTREQNKAEQFRGASG